MKFSIELLSEGQADCFLLLFENDNGDECSILIDGNCEKTENISSSKLLKRISELKKLDFIVVTHVDDDHLGGILSLFQRNEDEIPSISKQLKDSIIVYNNVTEGLISYGQAERFEKLIRDRKIINSFSNRYDNGKRMLQFLPVKLRKILELNEKNERNIYVTFLNPDKDGAKKVINDYKKYKYNDKQSYKKLINKNSIVLLIEFKGKTVLFSGDAYSKDIKVALEKLQGESVKSPISKIDCIKIPHHGALEYNKSLASIAKNFECRKFILTGKNEWDKKHPSEEILEDLSIKFSDEPSLELKIYTEVNLASINSKYAILEERCLKEIPIL